MAVASIIKKISGKNRAVIDSTHLINKNIIFSGNNDADHICEIHKSLHGHNYSNLRPHYTQALCEDTFSLACKVVHNILSRVRGFVTNNNELEIG
jgi:hypothetical protein